jgi:hypothetical protein
MVRTTGPGPNTLDIERQSKTYRGATDLAKNCVAANGAEAGDCQAPAGANAGNLAGVAYDIAKDGKAVALSEYAYAKVRAAGPIPLHSRVNVADAQGRVKAVDEAAGTAVILVGIAEKEAVQADQEIVVNLKHFGAAATA